MFIGYFGNYLANYLAPLAPPSELQGGGAPAPRHPSCIHAWSKCFVLDPGEMVDGVDDLGDVFTIL